MRTHRATVGFPGVCGLTLTAVQVVSTIHRRSYDRRCMLNRVICLGDPEEQKLYAGRPAETLNQRPDVSQSVGGEGLQPFQLNAKPWEVSWETLQA